jgi:drug/metabolite transporter (DMT)-like permease
MIKEFLLIIIVIGLLLVSKHGLDARSLYVALFCVFCWGIDYYFRSRKSEEPSKTEKNIANSWLAFRRLVCFVGAFVFLGAALTMSGPPSASLLENILVRLVLGVLGLFCIWVSVYGQGMNRYSLKDDVDLHKKNKKRYNWPW